MKSFLITYLFYNEEGIPAVFPKLVAEGYIVGKLSPAFSLGVAILCASLFKGTSYKN